MRHDGIWHSLHGSCAPQKCAGHYLRFATLFTFFLTALLGVFPLRRLLGPAAALLWICFVFVLPSAFYLAINIRMYPLAVFTITGEFIYAMLFAYQQKKSDLAWFFLFTLMALYTHYYCVILTAVIWLIVLVDLLQMKEKAKILKLLGHLMKVSTLTF